MLFKKEQGYKPTVKIAIYKNYLVLSLLDRGPKIKNFILGTQFSGFHSADLLLSYEVVDFFTAQMSAEKLEDPALEIISPFNMCWQSKNGIILPLDERINVYTLPHHKISDNQIDPKIKESIDNNFK